MLLAAVLTPLLLPVLSLQARNLYVYDRPACLPAFLGNLGGDVGKFINKNFVYPIDAWRVQKWDEVRVSVLVRVDGRVEEFYIEKNKEKPHPLLIAEMERVIDKMEWKPGYEGISPVNSYATFLFPLTSHFPKYNYHIPAGMNKPFEQAWFYACEWSLNEKDPIPDEQQEQQALRAMEKNGILFSDSPQILTGLVRALCSKNRPGQAVMFADGYLYPTDYWLNPKGKSQYYNNLKSYMRFHPSDEALGEEITQLEKGLISGQYAKNDDQLNLFGAKAMLVWLRDGDEGLSSYLAELRSGKLSGKLKKYLSRLEKRYNANSALLSDRRGVVEALACFVPPGFPTDDERRAFYARRRAVAEVFPIRWLFAVS